MEPFDGYCTVLNSRPLSRTVVLSISVRSGTETTERSDDPYDPGHRSLTTDARLPTTHDPRATGPGDLVDRDVGVVDRGRVSVDPSTSRNRYPSGSPGSRVARDRQPGRLRRALRRVEPSPPVVDWSILALVGFEVASGVLGLGAGHVSAWLLFDAHAVAGFALVVLLGFKLRRVRHRVTTARLWDGATPLSILQAVVALAALGTGIYWGFGGDFRLWFWTALNVHIGLGLLLVPLVLFHLRARYRPVRRTDFEGRRTALQYAGLLVGGAVAYRVQEATNALAGGAGERRRFTGSKPVDATTKGDGDVDEAELSVTTAGDEGGADDGGPAPTDVDGDGGGDRDVDVGNRSFPVTSWVADDPDPVDPDDYRLRVGGLVETPRTYDLSAVESSADASDRVLLDCTSGWYTVQDWRGVRLGDLLSAVGVRDEARWVAVHSVTGYRWSYPLGEARGMLLATHVGGERLSHGHGFPLRLVAPDRRGFQWIKWVDRIEVRRRRDATQYVATLVSGLD